MRLFNSLKMSKCTIWVYLQVVLCHMLTETQPPSPCQQLFHCWFDIPQTKKSCMKNWLGIWGHNKDNLWSQSLTVGLNVLHVVVYLARSCLIWAQLLSLSTPMAMGGTGTGWVPNNQHCAVGKITRQCLITSNLGRHGFVRRVSTLGILF